MAEKQNLFDDAIAEFTTSLNLLKKKFSVVDRKVEDLGKITDDFHFSTDKLEALFVRDIEKRKKYFQEHPIATGTMMVDGEQIDLSEIDKIFDQIENEEKRSTLSILMYLHNLGMIGVIGLSAYVFKQL